jgi:hypothetical protein
MTIDCWQGQICGGHYPGEYDSDVTTSIVDDLLALAEEAANV